jgi:hypothetical protein
MQYESPSRETTFGYLSTLHSPDYGYFGGYLILSTLGRPLEFHCTSPVQPSRAQEILYGPTLQSYLLGEQISGALLAAAKLTPQLILIDQPAMLLVRPQSSVPLVLVRARRCPNEGVATQKSNSEAGIASNAAAELETLPSGVRFTIGVYDVELPSSLEARLPAIEDLLNLLAQHVDLAEPFGRIHEAIREAQRIGGRTDDAHGQAA